MSPPTIAARQAAWARFDAAQKRWNDPATARRWSAAELGELSLPAFPRPREDELAERAAPAPRPDAAAKYTAALLRTLHNHKEGIEKLAARVAALEEGTAAAEFSRAQSSAATWTEFWQKAARARAGEGDADVHGYRN